jgi:hypothetical protein
MKWYINQAKILTAIADYDDQLIRRLIEKTPFTITVKFKSGVTVDVNE